jgi:phosphoribosylglycinamide formyltransferase 1
MSLRVGVLASGRGSNFQTLVDESAAGRIDATVVLLGCNRADAAVLGRAHAAGVPVCLADRRQLPKRADRQRRLREALVAASVDLLVLAGFDEVLLPDTLAPFEGRAINTHPSLLPAFGGTMHAVAEALAHGVKVTGCTVHLVTNETDAGPILFQEPVEVRDDDTVESLHARILAEEHHLLPRAVQAFAEDSVRIEGNRACVVPSAQLARHHFSL